VPLGEARRTLHPLGFQTPDRRRSLYELRIDENTSLDNGEWVDNTQKAPDLLSDCITVQDTSVEAHTKLLEQAEAEKWYEWPPGAKQRLRDALRESIVHTVIMSISDKPRRGRSAAGNPGQPGWQLLADSGRPKPTGCEHPSGTRAKPRLPAFWTRDSYGHPFGTGSPNGENVCVPRTPAYKTGGS
jgi:hypothetical protein